MAAGLEPVANGELVVPGTAIVVPVGELFDKLDRAREQSGRGQSVVLCASAVRVPFRAQNFESDGGLLSFSRR